MDQPHVTHGATLTPAERQARMQKAIDLRSRGASWIDVARECGWSNKQAAHQAVTTELRRRWRESNESVEALRQQEFERIDGLIQLAWSTIPGSKSETRLQAIDRLNRLMERKAKLMGLDAVQKVQVDGGLRVELVGVDVEDLK